MASGKIEKLVYEMALPIAQRLGYELVEAEYVKEGPNWFLRIYIDKPGGITIDDCQAMNDEIGPVIDREDPIEGSYFFEVSSPGLDRPLKSERDFEKYKGELVEVNLFAPVNGSKHYEGELIGKIDGMIVIKGKDGEISFAADGVSVVKRIIIF